MTSKKKKQAQRRRNRQRKQRQRSASSSSSARKSSLRRSKRDSSAWWRGSNFLAVVGIALTIFFGLPAMRGEESTNEVLFNAEPLAEDVWSGYETAEIVECIEGSGMSLRNDTLICHRERLLFDCFAVSRDIGTERRWAAVCPVSSGVLAWRTEILQEEAGWSGTRLYTPAQAVDQSPPFKIQLRSGEECWLSTGLVSPATQDATPTYGCPKSLVTLRTGSFRAWAATPMGQARVIDQSELLAFSLEPSASGLWTALVGSRADAEYERVAVVEMTW